MDLNTFRDLAGSYALIPVSREILCDLETPISAFWKLRRGKWSFLLESVEGGQRWARYTSMGTEPRRIYRATGTTLEIEQPGVGVEVLEVSDPLAFLAERQASKRLAPVEDLPRLFGGMVGSISYDAVRGMERLPEQTQALEDLPDFCFLEIDLVLVWDNLKHRAVLVVLADVESDSNLDAVWASAQARLDEASRRLNGPMPPLPTAPAEPPGAPVASCSDEDFASQVERARTFIQSGDVIQVVLSRRFSVAAPGLHPFLAYRALRQLNPSPYMFYLDMGETTLVGASPEVLVGATDGVVHTRPIAGTRRRGRTPEEDAALAEELKEDPKERAEHVMLVDLGRNDVGRISKIGSVRVDEYMAVERYSHVMHLVSHVSGQVRPGVTAAEIVKATFPAGTLSGAPKIRAMEIIEALEPVRRGYYGGAVGMLAPGGDLDLAITIRTLVARAGTFQVQAGAGIVYDSNPLSEAQETRDKARGALRALELAHERFKAGVTTP
jgi:anthranilate synthase component 1